MTYILAVVFALLMVVGDQLSKYFIEQNLTLGQSVPVLDKILNFTYIKNEGAVFGIMQDMRWLLISFTAIILVICIGILIKKAFKAKIMYWAMTLVLAGGVGNLIDRIFRGYVVDFIDVQFMDFYIFNIADCCVVVGVIMIFIYFIYDTIRDYRDGKKASVEEIDS